MPSITVKIGQSFLDCVIEATGDVSNAYLMAQANDVGITDVIPAGTELIIAGTVKKNIVALVSKNYAPATLFIDYLNYVFPQTYPLLF